MSPSRFCFNRECSEFNTDHYRPGWRLHTGDFAELCHRCASAYEQGIFCEMFHRRAFGWRCCESCGKKIHCGCIVSASTFMLLDAGGIECLDCARKKVSNFPQVPSMYFQSPISEKLKDLSINWNPSNQTNCQPTSLLSSFLQYDMHNRGDSQRNSKERPPEGFIGMNHTSSNILNNQKTGSCSSIAVFTLFAFSFLLTSVYYLLIVGSNCKVFPYPSITSVYRPLITQKEAPCVTNLASATETNCHARLDGSNLQHNDLNGGADSPSEIKSRNLRNHLDSPGKYRVVPSYCPKEDSDKDQVLEKQSKQYPSKLPKNLDDVLRSESVLTPLFEKILSANDTERNRRLRLPKKCAEAFFPPITEYEIVPIKVEEELTGKEWTFEFRFWTCRNSRMYILQGIGPWMQSLQLQPGDAVIFSRLDPERKLIVGSRKASVSPSSDQEIDSTNNNSNQCTKGDAEPVDTHSSRKVKKACCPSKGKKAASITEETETSKKKKKIRTMVTRSKRRKVEKGGYLKELKITSEEAQGLLLPPPNYTPSKVMIEGFEFEEYQDAPIIGKPTVSDEELHTSKNHTHQDPALRVHIDLNSKPEKEEESNAATNNYYDTSFTTPSSSSAHSLASN